MTDKIYLISNKYLVFTKYRIFSKYLIFAIYLIPSILLADWNVGCGDIYSGWHYYCDEEPPAPPKVNEPIKQAITKPAKTARDQLKEVQEKLEELKARAVMEPTEENLRDYMSFQYEQLNRATKFSDQWQRVVWANPNLDATINRPVNKLGKEAWIDNQLANIELSIKEALKNNGLYFVFSQKCDFCAVQSKILNEWQKLDNNITIIGVSLDKSILPEFPTPIHDNGNFVRAGLNPDKLPAIILYNSKTQSITPLTYGVQAIDELKNRIYTITSLKVGEGY